MLGFMREDRIAELESENLHLRAVNEQLTQLALRPGLFAAYRSDTKRLYGHPFYHYLPYSPSAFLSALSFIRKKFAKGRKPKFVDVGCGIGDKVVLAYELDFRSRGIEFDSYLCRYAKRVYGLTDAQGGELQLLNCSPLTHSYDSYDVIFIDSPYQDDKHQLSLETQIFKDMKEGAYLMSTKICEPPKDFVYVQEIEGIHIFNRTRRKKSK